MRGRSVWGGKIRNSDGKKWEMLEGRNMLGKEETKIANESKGSDSLTESTLVLSPLILNQWKWVLNKAQYIMC